MVSDSAAYRDKNVGVNVRSLGVKHRVTMDYLVRDASLPGLENSSAKESEKFPRS